MSGDDKAWEDLGDLRLSDADAWRVIEAAKGCTACWARPDGHALGVWVTHAVIDGVLYLTTTDNRPKTRAWKRDPRMSACFGMPGLGSVTVVGTIELGDEASLLRRFLEALCDRLEVPDEARESWIGHMESPGRLVGRVRVDHMITFDERKLEF